MGLGERADEPLVPGEVAREHRLQRQEPLDLPRRRAARDGGDPIGQLVDQGFGTRGLAGGGQRPGGDGNGEPFDRTAGGRGVSDGSQQPEQQLLRAVPAICASRWRMAGLRNRLRMAPK